MSTCRAMCKAQCPAPAAQVGVGVNASPFNDNRPEQWRYRQDNGHWWYWTPENRWMWYNGTQWTYYDQPSTGVTTTVQPAPYTTNYGSYDYAPSYGYGYGYGYPYYGGSIGDIPATTVATMADMDTAKRRVDRSRRRWNRHWRRRTASVAREGFPCCECGRGFSTAVFLCTGWGG